MQIYLTTIREGVQEIENSTYGGMAKILLEETRSHTTYTSHFDKVEQPVIC